MTTSRGRVRPGFYRDEFGVVWNIAPSHYMPGDIPVENMLAFIEAVRG